MNEISVKDWEGDTLTFNFECHDGDNVLMTADGAEGVYVTAATLQELSGAFGDRATLLPRAGTAPEHIKSLTLNIVDIDGDMARLELTEAVWLQPRKVAALALTQSGRSFDILHLTPAMLRDLSLRIAQFADKLGGDLPNEITIKER